MSTPPPIRVLKQVAWISLPVHLAVMAVLILAIQAIVQPARPLTAVFYGLMVYIIVSHLLRKILLRDLMHGHMLLTSHRFAESIPYFERSYDFFTRHPLVDRWRYLLVLSSNAIKYREMALQNIAVARVHMDEPAAAKECYRRLIAEFPDSPLAEIYRQTLEAAEAQYPTG